MMKKREMICIAAAAVIMSSFAGCSSTNPNAETASEDSSESGSFTSADVAALLGNSEDGSVTGSPDENSEEVTFATVTDVENEVDRAIYKAQVAIPDGWALLQDTNMGKLYASANASLKIQADNFGADAELTDLDTMAEGAAVSIVMSNMYYQADTEFGDPVHCTVAGQDAVRYDYTVTSYIFTVDDEGNRTGDKEVVAVFKDRLYALYNGTDSYYLMFETGEADYERVSPVFDEMVESFTIAEDGTAGYESASIFMSEYEESSLSALFSMLDEEDDDSTDEADISESAGE